MIPSPNLDDRKFEDIVEEAIRLIPQYCPEWTNFNKADPGVTLLEMFAWMSEMVLYRLNRVPERNYLAFLNLLGIRLQPPQPAKALVQFEISDRIDQVRIPAGTRVATKPSDDRPPVQFETDTDLLAVSNRLLRCMSQHGQTFSDNTPFLTGNRGAFEVFGGARSIDRYLYLGDARFEAFGEDAILIVRFEAQGAGEREFHELMEWEYWDGGRWRSLSRASMDLERNHIAFLGPPETEVTTVNDVESFWIRGRLFEVPRSDEETVLDTISARLEVLGHGVVPGSALCNAEGDLFTRLDLDKNFIPLGKSPGIDTTLYLAADEILGQPDSRVSIDIQLSDQTVADVPRPSHDLVLRWEFHNGKRWKILARCKAGDGSIETEYDFVDEAKCFSETGSMSFERPKDLAQVAVEGTEAFWIRCRVEVGNYGVPGSYELADKTWVWKDEKPLLPPSLKSLTLRFQERPHALEHCLVYNDFVFTDHTRVAAAEYKPFQAFQPVADESPTLYLGWEAPFPNDTCSVYLHVVDDNEHGGRAAVRSFDDRAAEYVEQRVAWEYWSGKGWSALAPKDTTENFSHSGFISFVGPVDSRKGRRFGESLYWMRARLEMGGYDEPPMVNRILINAAPALNVTTYGNTGLGSSRGTPNQFFSVPQTPVLDGENLEVREPEAPRDEEREALIGRFGDAAIVDDEEFGGAWVRWRPVESFFDQGPRDRVYTKDVATGVVRFGDGIKGLLPPKGDRNVRMAKYRVGGGAEGNVPAGAIEELQHSLAFVSGVSNPFAASGGCDMESVEDAKQRAPHVIKARNRAVTVDDFEWLAREASNGVARVKCLPSTAREGEITVVVVPKAPVHATLAEKPMPTVELLKRVRQYLDGRRLVSTIVNVVRPAYVELSVEVEFVKLQTGASDRIRRGIEDALRRYLHPLVGGRNGKGWPFGRAVLKMDLYQVVEEVGGVDFVNRISMFDELRRVDVEQLRVADDQLVHLVNVDVSEKAHDRIV